MYVSYKIGCTCALTTLPNTNEILVRYMCVCIERCLQFCVMYICCRNTQRKDTGFGRKQIATQTLPTTELFKRHEKFALEHHAYTFRSLLLAFVSMLLTLNWMGFACIYMWWWWSKRFAIFFLYTWITNAHISITLNLSRFLVCVLGLVVGVILIQQPRINEITTTTTTVIHNDDAYRVP